MKISRSTFIIIVLACISVTIVSQELRKVVTDVVKAGSQIWVKGTDVTTFFDNLSGNKTTSLSYGANSIDEDAIADNAIQNRHIEDMTIGWPETSLSLRDSIRNAKPTTDNITLTIANDTLAIKNYADSTALKAASAKAGDIVSFKELSAANAGIGGGSMVYLPGHSYVYPAAIGNWVRLSWLETRRISDRDAGIVFGTDQSYATTNREKLQKAIDLCYYGSKGEVLITGSFYVNKVPSSSPAYCIDPRSGVTIRGASSQPSPGNGSAIRMADGQNATVLYAKIVADADEWWHQGRIENLTIDCNGANNTTANGIDIYRPGEASYISSVQITNIAGFGYKESKSATAKTYLENVSVFPNSSVSQNIADKKRIGFWFIGAGQRSITSLSGDNLNPFVYIQGAASMVFNGIKYESQITASPSYFALIDTTDTGSLPDGNTSQLAFDNIKVDASDLNSFFKVNSTGITMPSLAITNSMLSGYDSLFVSNTSISNIGYVGQMIRAIYVGGNTQATIQFYTDLTVDYSRYLRFRDHLGNSAGYLRYETDQKMHFRSPRSYILFEDYNGNDLFELNTSQSWGYVPHNQQSDLRLNSYINFSEQSAPSNPSANNARMWAQDDGSGNTIVLIKFSNGDIDTLASSLTP